MKKKIKIGVIGLGMGSNHVESYLQHPHATVEALCDINPERLREKAAKYNIRSPLSSHASQGNRNVTSIMPSVAQYSSNTAITKRPFRCRQVMWL